MLIPNWKQFSNWSMPAKVGYLGFIMALIQFLFWLIPDKPNFSDRLIQEQNKPEVKIARVELQNFYQQPEPYVVVIIENISQTIAKNINIKMLGNNEVVDFPNDPIRDKYLPDNLAIKPNKETAIPLLPLSKYNQLINPDSPEQRLIEVKTSANNENSSTLNDKVCGEIKHNFTTCSFSRIQLSTAIQINFESPFEQSFSLNTQFFNVYLNEEIRAI